MWVSRGDTGSGYEAGCKTANYLAANLSFLTLLTLLLLLLLTSGSLTWTPSTPKCMTSETFNIGFSSYRFVSVIRLGCKRTVFDLIRSLPG